MNFFGKAPLAPPSAIRYGVEIVRKIFAEAEAANGLSSAEIYQRALQHPIPEGYEGDKRFAADNPNLGPSKPPHNEHPVRSRAFLKQHILPVLQGSNELHKVVVDREITAPILSKSKKGKITGNPTKPTAGASPTNPVTVKAWVWKVKPPQPEEEQKEVKEPFGAAVGVGQDFSHLSKRRQGAREEKIQRDVQKMRLLAARKRQARKAS